MLRFKLSRLLFVLLPSVVVLGGCVAATTGTVLSGYGSNIGANGGQRDRAHAGTDYGGSYGDKIIAAADGNSL